MTTHEIARIFGTEPIGPGKYKPAHCPAPGHGNGNGDRHPSLSLKAGRDGRTLVRCNAGCETKDVLAAKGLTMKDLFADSDKPRSRNGETVRRRAAAIDDGLHLSDLGNSYRLALHHGDDLRYVHPWRRWLVWDGSRWARDETGEVMRRAAQVPRLLGLEADDEPDADKRKAIRSWANATESASRQAALVAMAKHNEHVVARPADFDREPLLLCVANGTVDLRTGELRPHRREDMMLKLAPVDYGPHATCPRWLEFLARVLPSPALRAFFQRALGYSLTGDIREHALFLCHGQGANGKTVAFEVMQEILGDYGTTARADTFLAKRDHDGSKASPDVARLHGARFVSVNETPSGARLDESLVKDLTGGDAVTARQLYAEEFSFHPRFKLWIRSNYKPVIRGTDLGIWRRVHFIPFAVTIPESERDHQLPGKLRDELPGILRWAVEGAIAWQRDGLSQPDEVRAATAGYRAEQDHLGDFLAECCVALPSAFASRSALRQRYDAWCAASGEKPLGRHDLNERLRLRFAEEQPTTGARERGWRGVGLRDATPRAEPENPTP